MIQKQTLLVPSDKSGVWLAKTIHTYSKLSRLLKVNFFGKASLISTSPGNLLRRKKKKLLYTRSAVSVRRCGLLLNTYRSSLLLKKRLTPLGRRVVGFTLNEVTRKKALSSFIKIL